MTCACISHNDPQPGQTDPEVLLTVPIALRAAIGRDAVCVDACIAEIIKDIWAAGIVTRGSCCGHNGRHRRSVIVDDTQAAEAKALLVARGESMAVLCWRLVEEPPKRLADWPYYAADLLPLGVVSPPDFDDALTVAGLVSHGAKRFPGEWETVLRYPDARLALLRWLFSSRPDDGEQDCLSRLALEVIAGHATR